MNYIFGALLSIRGLGQDSVDSVRSVLANLPDTGALKETHREALDCVRSAFALLLTAVGIPMFLAGEEFADVHDLQYGDDRLKMSDPVDWYRRSTPGHATLVAAVAQLIRLRTSTDCLQRNEIEFLYFHPEVDQNNGARVFAYCRTSGRPLGSTGQVIVVANAGAETYTSFDLPFWPWGVATEIAAPADAKPAQFSVLPGINVPLGPFQARVFKS